MKKITLVSLASFMFLFLASCLALVTRYVFRGHWSPLIIGVAILATSGIICAAVRESTKINVLCFFLSAVAMGILIRAWYNLRGLDNTIMTMLAISLSLVLYLWIFFALTRIPIVHKSRVWFIVLCVFYLALSVTLYCIAVAKTETTYVSTFGYYMIIELAFIFAMCLEVSDGEELMRNLTLSTYSVFIVAIIVLVFALIAALGGDSCDCDCGGGDCCDCDCGPDSGYSESKKAKRKKKRRLVNKY